jgi:molybdate transport system ATP-binding protein
MRLRVDIRKHLRAEQHEFKLDVRFESDADITVLFGPSGGGKTLTILAIAGLLRPDSGTIELDGRLLFDSAYRVELPARLRNIGLVFQDYALFPHLNVAQNIAFSKTRRWFNARRSVDAKELLTSFELDAYARSYPSELSGGQRQRVALARAFAAQPKLLLLDEPFAALDAPLRARLRDELLAIRRRFDIPVVVITHDPEDVAALGGKSIPIERGRVASLTP